MMTHAPITVTYGKGFEVAVPMAERVKALQDESLKFPQVDIVTTHTFLPGIYERAIVIPAWTVLTGAEHKTSYRARLEKGTIAVTTDIGIKILTAPCEFESKVGVQRAGWVFDEEVVWVDVYDNPDNCTDLAVLEERLYVVPECGLGASRTDAQKARIDYGMFLHQLGTTDAEILKIAQTESDLIDMPDGWAVELKPSPIHGMGLFAAQNFEAGETVCPGRIDGKRTPGGRYINHSANNNVLPKLIGDDIFVVASRKITAGDELVVDYRASLKVNFGIIV